MNWGSERYVLVELADHPAMLFGGSDKAVPLSRPAGVARVSALCDKGQLTKHFGPVEAFFAEVEDGVSPLRFDRYGLQFR